MELHSHRGIHSTCKAKQFDTVAIRKNKIVNLGPRKTSWSINSTNEQTEDFRACISADYRGVHGFKKRTQPSVSGLKIGVEICGQSVECFAIGVV